MAMGDWLHLGSTVATVRPPVVAGSFYPSDQDELTAIVAALRATADRSAAARGAVGDAGGVLPAGILVPHAGLVYSGVVAAAGWRALEDAGTVAPTVVLLGTNHAAGWLDGIGAWETGAWRTPLGEVAVDADLASSILTLGSPFGIDRRAHLGEHSIEVQLPLLQSVAPDARIVPLAVSAGTGALAVEAGSRLGELLARRLAAGDRIVLAISSDMAHYPAAGACAKATAQLLPAILAIDAVGLARTELGLRREGIPGLACGMCGIEPAVVGLATLAAMGTAAARPVAEATSADAGGPRDRTVGYLAVQFLA
jgi:AmmeMemoRadiSam system protein B